MIYNEMINYINSFSWKSCKCEIEGKGSRNLVMVIEKRGKKAYQNRHKDVVHLWGALEEGGKVFIESAVEKVKGKDA